MPTSQMIGAFLILAGLMIIVLSTAFLPPRRQQDQSQPQKFLVIEKDGKGNPLLSHGAEATVVFRMQLMAATRQIEITPVYDGTSPVAPSNER